jgi:autotransporter-associated beta strand protein
MNTKSIKIFKTKILILTVFLAAIINYSKCQTTVTYTQQTVDYDQTLTTNGSGGIYNNGSTEIGMWMDGDNSSSSYAGNVLWKTFRVGSSTSNSTRNLNIGDEFVITVSTKGFYYGTIGVSLNSGSLPSATWANRISNSRIRVQQDGLNFGGGTPGSWYYSGTSAGSFNITPTGSYVNYEIRVKIISQDRCNISVNGTWIYDVELGGTSGAAITHYSIYMSDDRAGIWSTPNRGNSYWKQSTILQNTGNMTFGSSNTSFSITEALTNGLDANSTSANSLNNSLTKSGSGTLTLAGSNVYAGATTISAGTLKLAVSSSSSTSGPLGTTAAGTTVSSGAVLDLNGNSLSGSATEALTLNGDGISHGGALINSSSNPSVYIGAITLGTGSRLNATTGNITLSGNISGGSNSLYVGGSNNTSISGIISGAGGGTDGSLFKDGSGTLTLSGANDYTGQTQINNGELWIESSGSISASSAIYLGNGGLMANVAKLWLSNSTGGTTFSNNVTVNPGNTTTRYLGGLNNSGTHTFSGDITNNSTNGLHLSALNSGGFTTFSGVISGTNAVIVEGAGTVTLSGTTDNSYSGNTTVNCPLLILNKTAGKKAIGNNLTIATGKIVRTDADNQFGTGIPALVTIEGTGDFNCNNTNQKIALVSSSSSAEVILGSGTLTIDNTMTDTYAGIISGTGGVIKSGSGTLALAGVNTYTGLTTVSAGTLHINASGGCIPSANDIAVSGGTLHVSYDQIIDDLTATSGTITVDAGKTLTVNGKLSISNGVTINLNSTGKIAYGPNADLEFTGSATISDAVWPATGGPTDIIVNGSGITVTLDKSRTISGNMTLTSGVVTLGNYDLTVTGSLTGGGATAYINTGGTGKLIRSIATATQVTYPVGNVAYSPITLNFASGTFNSAYVSVRTDNTKHGSNISNTHYINRHWVVNQTGITGFNCQVVCNYTNGDIPPGASEANIYCGKFNGSIWTLGNLADAANNTLTFSNNTSFSDFTGGELSAMPVSWLFFNCKPDKNHINLNWGVSEEPATGIYTIERSIDGRNWEAIGTKTPSGQSFTTTSYHFADLRPLLQAYYRIKHTENLNEIQYSEMCFAQMKPEEKPKIKMDVTNNQIIVSLPTLSENTSTISLYDLCGRKLKHILATKTHGHITTSDLPSGIYELIIEHPGYRHAEKILIFN